MPRYPTAKQNIKVLKALQDANGGWVSKDYLVRGLGLTQAGARLFELKNEYHWPIETSDFTNEYGFKSYRLLAEEPQTLSLIVWNLNAPNANKMANG